MGVAGAIQIFSFKARLDALALLRLLLGLAFDSDTRFTGHMRATATHRTAVKPVTLSK